MTYIFMALFCEAAPVIKALGLKKEKSDLKWDIYRDEAERLCLVITGVGPIASAAAVSAVFAKYGAGKGDKMLNLGTCCVVSVQGDQINSDCHLMNCEEDTGCRKEQGDEDTESRKEQRNGNIGDQKEQRDAENLSCHMAESPNSERKIGEILLINKLTDGTTGRDFYPDMNITLGIRESAVTSMAQVIYKSAGQNIPTGVYDMEAAFIYQAAKFYIGPGQMFFLKVVSDNGIKPDTAETGEYAELSQRITGLMEASADVIVKFINSIIDEEYVLFANESRYYPDEGSGANSKPVGSNPGEGCPSTPATAGSNTGEGCPVNSRKRDRNSDKSLYDKLQNELRAKHVLEDFCATVAMEKKLVQAFYYAELAGIDYREMLQKMYDDGRLPAQNKKEGILRMEEIVSEIQRGD